MRMIGAGEGFRGVAIREVAHRDFVGLRFRMQQQRGAAACRDRIEHRFERLVIDLDQFGSVLGDIAAIRHHQRHRLADIAHPLDGERPLVHRRLHRGEEWIGELAHLLPGDHRPDAGMIHGFRRVDTFDVGMGVGRPDHMGMQRADRHRQIVGIAPAPGQQRRIFLAEARFCAVGFGHR